MAIELYREGEPLTTLLCVFNGRWSWDELFATLRKIKQLTQEVDHEVAAILDVRQGMHLPTGLFTPHTLDQAKKLLALNDGKAGPIVVVGVNPVIRGVFDAVARLDQRAVASVSFVDHLDQAREQLAARRSG